MRRLLAASIVGVALPIALATAAAAAGPGDTEGDAEDVIVLTGTAIVQGGETVHDVVVFHGEAVIDGTALGSVIAFDGPVTISGRVRDGVYVLNGLLVVEDGASVSGDVVADRYRIDRGASVSEPVRRVRSLAWAFDRGFAFVAAFAVWLAVTMSVLALGLLAVWIAPRGMDAVALAARTGTGPAIGWGVALFVGLPLAAVVAIATLVGIPFGLGLLLALAMIYAVGHTTSAWLLGRLLVRGARGRAVAFLAGWVILAGLSLVPWFGGPIWFGATVFGLGSIVVALWRARRAAAPSLATATLPPPPPTPARG